MDLLSDFEAPDPVTEVLRAVRIRSTVYCRSVLGAPWGFGVTAHGNSAFHVVTTGTCTAETTRGPSGELAGEVALSRSAFSARFRHLVGEPPTRYITRTVSRARSRPRYRHAHLGRPWVASREARPPSLRNSRSASVGAMSAARW